MPRTICLVWTATSSPGSLYDEVIAPAIEDAGMSPVLLEDETNLDAVLLAPCVALAAEEGPLSPFVAYAMGLREARGRKTVLLLPEPSPDPLDGCLTGRTVRYRLSPERRVSGAQEVRKRLSEELAACPQSGDPLALLDALEHPPMPAVAHGITDRFRERLDYAPEWRARLSAARSGNDLPALKRAEAELDATRENAAVWVDLLLSYRGVEAWDEMIGLVERMPLAVSASRLVQEQLGFALNRAGDTERAEEVLRAVLEKCGPSSETNSLLGRVYKDRWESAKAKEEKNHQELLDRAIDEYLSGFESDPRDPYPGINAATLMEVGEPPDPRRERVLPVVLFAAERRGARADADYWTHATLLEAAVLSRDRVRAEETLPRALEAVREAWEPETTARNLRIIREAREGRGEDLPWARPIEDALAARATR